MKLVAALAVPVLALGASVLSVAPASAHTPSISADCSGVHVSASAYDATLPNRWSVTVAGSTQSGTFGDSFDRTFPVPQDGSTVPWSAFVEASDGTYHGEDAGTVGPCGTPPDACAGLPGNQPAGTACTPPPDVQRVVPKALEGCDVVFGNLAYGPGRLTYDEQYTDTYVFNPSTNVFDLVPDTTATIADVAFTAYTGAEQVAHGCVGRPPRPPALESVTRHTRLDCAHRVRVTTTIRTVYPFVYDAPTNTWVPGTPVEHVTRVTKHVGPAACGATGGQTGGQTGDHGHGTGGQGHGQQAQGHATFGATVRPAAVTSAPAGTAQVPTVVDAGMAGPATAPGTRAVAGVTRTPGGLLLLLTGAALLSLAGLRPRRG